MSWRPIRKLEVRRTFSDGRTVSVGTLAQNREGVYFQYAPDYLHAHANLSPFTLNWAADLQQAPASPHEGLHGVFADGLPDGWGRLIMDRVFRRHAIAPSAVTPMDRLAFVGDRTVGALSYHPHSELAPAPEAEAVDLHDLGLRAQALFDGQTEDVLAALVTGGSSGGARPKAQIYFPEGETRHCRTIARPGDSAWLVKFTSGSLPLGHEEGLCEAIYLTLADAAALQPPEFRLLDAAPGSGASKWLALRRFDRVALRNGELGRRHLHSACGLLDADFRLPSLDYEDLIKATSMLCNSPRAGQLQFRRAMFNLFALNHDDHSRNWAFLQDDSGTWQPAPFYDVTFSPQAYQEHATAFCGHGRQPPLAAVERLAAAANFASWSQARTAIEATVDALSTFRSTAHDMGLQPSTIKLIGRQLDQAWRDNRHLLR